MSDSLSLNFGSVVFLILKLRIADRSFRVMATLEGDVSDCDFPPFSSSSSGSKSIPVSFCGFISAESCTSSQSFLSSSLRVGTSS